MPCEPGASASLHVVTCLTTCLPQSLGLVLPVMADSLTPAAPTARVAAATPIAALVVSTAAILAISGMWVSALT